MPVLSDSDLFVYANAHFGDLGPVDVAIAVAICKAESAGELWALNDNYPRWQSEYSPYRWDYGLMQINSIHNYDSYRLLTDANYNFACARIIWDSQGWNAWTSFRWGTYLQFYVEPVIVPPQPSVPVLPSINDMYLWITDAYYPSYSTAKTEIIPIRYDGNVAVYELRRE